MTQRNPMNDRYQNDEHRGTTRKSAASVKPKSKAASSVRVQPMEKNKQQKKAEKKVSRQKQTALDRKYYNPPTSEYKRLRKIWWALLIGAIVTTGISWLARPVLPETATYVALGLAYVFIIGALYVDFAKIRKVRRAYQEKMEAGKSKEQRAAEKQEKAVRREIKKEAEQKYDEAKAPDDQPRKLSLFGKEFRLPRVMGSRSERKNAESDDAGVSTDEKNLPFERGKANASAAAKAAKTHDSEDSAM